MKILIVSDSHGRNQNLVKVIDKVSPIDLLVHLGDFEGKTESISDLVSCKCELVAGNNDFFTSADKEKLISIGNYRVFMTHGHRYGINYGTDRIKDMARSHWADMVFCGHTHRPLIEISDDVWVINPGSISQPRQEGGKPTYIIMDIDSSGKAHFTLNYL
jgi:uncharacterized protein